MLTKKMSVFVITSLCLISWTSVMADEFKALEVQGSHEKIHFSGLDGLVINLSLSGLKELIPSLYLNYQHAGLEKIDEVPPELTPENFSLGLRISRIPVMEIIGPVMGAQVSGPVILEILSRNDSQLEI